MTTMPSSCSGTSFQRLMWCTIRLGGGPIRDSVSGVLIGWFFLISFILGFNRFLIFFVHFVWFYFVFYIGVSHLLLQID